MAIHSNDPLPRRTPAVRSAASARSAPDLFQAENRIFAAWHRRQPTLLRDGALGGPESTYMSEPVRVLFVLKEPNDTGGRWTSTGADLRLQTSVFADLRSTFPVVLLLAALAQSIDSTPALAFAEARQQLQDVARRQQLLRSVALVNLKKTPGGAVCNDRSLVRAVEEDSDLLSRQLALYRPHLTIAGGASVHRLLSGLMQQPVQLPSGGQTRPSFRDPRLGLCLSFVHPQATKGYEYLFDLLRSDLLAHGFSPA